MPVLILYLSLSCFLPEGGVVTDNPRKDVPTFIPVDGVISWWKSELTVRAKVVPNCNVHYELSEDPSIGYILGQEPGHRAQDGFSMKWSMVCFYSVPYFTFPGSIQFKIGENHCLENKIKTVQSGYAVLNKEFLNNTSLAAKGALTHRLQRRTACKMQNGRKGAPKWRTGSAKVSTPRFLGFLSNFH